MVELREEDGGFDLLFAGKIVVRHRPNSSAFAMARGDACVTMRHGHFDFLDQQTDRTSPTDWARLDNAQIMLSLDGRPMLRIILAEASIEVVAIDPSFDRLSVRIHADAGEAVWGGGEQMSYLTLNGRSFPMWTSEPGVGRDKSTELTRLMDAQGNAGGDYWTTNYPQPTILTSRWLAVHCDCNCYSQIDCRDPAWHSFDVWAPRARFELYSADGPASLVSLLSSRFGRQPPLPDWAIGGAIVGLKSGVSSLDRLEQFVAAGASIAGLWCEDWAGIRETSFGRRLFWDWATGARSEERYPDLQTAIGRLAERGIRFLGYANPYLAVDGDLFAEAEAGGHFCLRRDVDEVYLVDFGEFECGVVDFTRDATRDWFAERILGREMLDIGMAGWMADFGEYLPTDVRLADGSDPMEAHNRWPILWGTVNAQAVAGRGRTGDALFFMRAGFSGIQAECPLLWAGDQSVDFSRHDGIGTVVTAALSAGLVGNAYSHSDCGGYTSIHGLVRSEELMQRWCELAAFAPVMRSHEGNRPDDNLQFDSTPALLACFARWSRVHAHLAPYVRALCDEAKANGLPAQRPLFLHYPDDPSLFQVQDQYLYGSDLIVAPVIEAGSTSRSVILPGSDNWRCCWTGTDIVPGVHDFSAPIGRPPVFYRPDSRFAALFAGIRGVAWE